MCAADQNQGVVEQHGDRQPNLEVERQEGRRELAFLAHRRVDPAPGGTVFGLQVRLSRDPGAQLLLRADLVRHHGALRQRVMLLAHTTFEQL